MSMIGGGRRRVTSGVASGTGVGGSVSPAPLRPLGVTEILDTAVRLVRRNAAPALLLAVPFAVLRGVLVALVAASTVQLHDGANWQTFLRPALTSLVLVVFTGLLAPAFASDLRDDRRPGRAALSGVARSIGPLVLLAVIVSVGEQIGLVLLVVGGVWLWGVWAVAAPALAIERLGPIAALRRSKRLVRGSFWRVWSVRALGWVLTSVLGFLITLPFTAIASAVTGTDPLTIAVSGVRDTGLYVTIIGIGTVLASMIVLPIAAAVDVVIYTDLRVRREGMDIVLALSDGDRRW